MHKLVFVLVSHHLYFSHYITFSFDTYILYAYHLLLNLLTHTHTLSLLSYCAYYLHLYSFVHFLSHVVSFLFPFILSSPFLHTCASTTLCTLIERLNICMLKVLLIKVDSGSTIKDVVYPILYYQKCLMLVQINQDDKSNKGKRLYTKYAKRDWEC